MSAILKLSNRHRWSIVGLLFAASFINYFDRATLSMALPYISKDLNLGPEQKGILLSSFFWSYCLMQIPVGWLSDRVNLRWLYAAAFALWSIAQGLTGFADTLVILITFRILLGIGESVYLPGGSKIVSMMFSSKERGLPVGLFDFGTRTGLVLEGLVVPWSIYNYGWRRTFIVVGFAALLWLLPWLLITPKRLQEKAEVIAARPKTASKEKIRSLLTNRNLWGICIGFFCFDYYWYLLVTWLPDYLVTVRGMGVMKAGIYSALPFLVFGASQPIGGWISDRLVQKGYDETLTRKMIVTISFATGLLLIPAAKVESADAALAYIMGGCLVGLGAGNLQVILQSCAPPNEVGLWTGIENFIGNLAGVIAPIATGYIIKLTGSYTPAFILAALVLVFGLLAYWFIVGKLEPPEPELAT